MARTGTVAAAIALALAWSAPAQAQQFDEAECRSSTGLRASCVGIGKLGERISAECRRAGVVGDEECWSRIGRRVIRAEVDRYQQSWTHQTLSFQQSLSDGLPFRDASWVGTHNSYNSTSEEPTLSHTDSNQQLTLEDQLRLDVRSLELDVHWLPSARAGGAEAPVLCHGQGNAGCTTERLLSERLVEVNEWLLEHPDEVLLLYLEDGIDNAAGYGPAAQVVSDTFGGRLYRPRGTGCTELPLDLTRDAVRAAGAQVVVVSDCGQGAWQGIAHSWPGSVRSEHRPKGFQPYPACGPPAAADWRAKLVRYYEDSTFVSAFAEPSGFSSTDDGLTPATTRELTRCGVELTGFDQLLPRDGRLDALVWSWADGEPAHDGAWCAAQNRDGRWEARSCSQKLRPACRGAYGEWTVLAKAVRRKQASGACADAGLALGTPRTGWENQRLRDAAPEGTSVWLSHRSARR